MPNFAIIPNSGVTISALASVVDGFPEETHKIETTTGGEPLEDGRAVTDHAVARQDRLVLQGWVSNFNGGERPRAAWETIRRLHKAVEAVTVMTEWGVYDEMIIRRAEAPKRHRGMQFTLELEEIIRVGLTDNELPATQTSGPAQGRAGEVQRGRVSLPPAVA